MQANDVIVQLQTFGITNKLEQAHFLGQSDHESQGFTKFTEGTNFRFSTAKKTWPSRVDVISAKQAELSAKDSDFCPQPWLFNTTYGSRMGNGRNGIKDNDGFDYRGSGIFMLTGTDNYLCFLNWLHSRGQYLSLDINSVDEFVKTQDGAIVSAIWFWLSKNIGRDARADNITKVSIAINGGTIGIVERQALTEKYKKLLGVK